MSNQNFENTSEIIPNTKLMDEFQNIEIIIQSIFQVLDEYDRMNASLQKTGGENIE
ncbi:MAG: hypothetical protein PVG23_02555 [Nitrosopumilaceae archaeon]|jgi:hypothetical protein